MELRKIMFSLAEVQAAVCAFCRTRGMPVVETEISHLTISEDPRETVALHFRRVPEQRAPNKKVLRREEVADALIQYCVRHRVPLPRASKKVLWPREDGILLMITLTSGGERPAPTEKDAFSGAATLHTLFRRDR